MHKWKKLLFLPLWLLVVFTLLSAAGLAYVFINRLEETIVAYPIFAFSAYTLTVVCIYAAIVLPKKYRSTKEKVYAHPIGNRYMTDAAYRVTVSLHVSLIINLVYSVFKLIAGIVLSSFWWGAIAVYYLILSLTRYILLRHMRHESYRKYMQKELRAYRACGALLLLLNLTLTGIVFQMVWQNRNYSYPGYLIFAVAAYTFYTVTISIVDIVRYRKYKSPVMSAAKAIRFAAALVSLLSLETAMLAQFGSDPVFERLMTALTGAGVCLIVVGMSVYMVLRANKAIQLLKGEK